MRCSNTLCENGFDADVPEVVIGVVVCDAATPFVRKDSMQKSPKW